MCWHVAYIIDHFILYLHLGHWGTLKQFEKYKAETEEEEEEVHSAQEQRQDL